MRMGEGKGEGVRVCVSEGMRGQVHVASSGSWMVCSKLTKPPTCMHASSVHQLSKGMDGNLNGTKGDPVQHLV